MIYVVFVVFVLSFFCFFVFFFFFKQKTAYEIVSRDWSSDVCSSDLIGNSKLCSYNTQSKSYWLINTQSRALQADWSMLENNEKGTLKIALACKLSLSSKLSDVFSRMDHYYQHDSLDLDAILRHSRELHLTSITGKRITSIPLYTLEDENIARDRLFVCYGFFAFKNV